MKFLRLAVKSFRGIAEAHIDFAPGLNVLFGPNEAGKSTLAEALRAVLLCRAGSSASESYLPAIGAGAPEVSLTFADVGGTWLRIDKTFGERPSTSLERSANQGQTFVREATGDGAETELRKRLRWGLRPPGGRGGARGVESTFLTRTLLAEQTEVDAIFKEGLEPESTEQLSFVQEALAAAMDNPRFKDALKLANQRCDLYFTSRGGKTRGANSPWTRARDQLNEAQTDLNAAQKVAEEIAALERSLVLAQDEASAARRALDAARAERNLLEQKLQSARHRELLVSEVEAARRNLGDAVARQLAVEALRIRVDEFARALETKTAELEAAMTARQIAQHRREEAQAQLQRVEALEGKAVRELELTRIESQLVALGHEREGLNRKMTDAESLARDERGLCDLRERIDGKKSALATAKELETKMSKQIAELEAQRTAALVLEADRRLQTATDRAARAAAEVQAAQAAAEQAEAKGLVEEQLRNHELTYGNLDTAQVERVRRLHHELDKHRSAAAAGLSVAIERLQALELGTRVDDETGDEHPPSTGRLQVDARRRIQLDLQGLAKLEITAGSPEIRAELSRAEVAWARDGQPLLDHHGVRSVEALEHRLRDRMEAHQQLNDVRRERSELIERAQRLAEVREALTQAQLEAKEAEAARCALPARAEATATVSVRELDHQLTKLRASAKDAESGRIASGATLRQLEESEREKAARITEQQRAIGEPGLELVTRSRARLDAIEDEAKALQQQRNVLEERRVEALRAAQEAVASAKETQETADGRGLGLEEDRREIEKELEMTRGRLMSEEAHLTALDIEGRRARFAEVQATLDAHPPISFEPGSVEAADARIQEAESRVEESKGKIIKLEGRMASGEGGLAQERLEEARAAYEVAETNYKATEIDGEASKLLVEAMKEAETSSTRHVGAAIGGKVETRFAELTRNRYRGLSVDQALVAQNVQLGEAVLRPEQLSVGTRHQLAILLRLILAEQLGHPIVLDDQLVQSDPERLAWFRELLVESATKTQVLVLSCRPDDYRGPAGPDCAHLVDVSARVKLNQEHGSRDASAAHKELTG